MPSPLDDGLLQPARRVARYLVTDESSAVVFTYYE
jgi:hypothetical protein